MKLLVLDTETTGSLKEDRICQLSFLVLNEKLEVENCYNDLCLPPVAIGLHAMAIHHITPETVENKPSCVETQAFKKLNELNSCENILVIQNASFDLQMLEKEGFKNEMACLDTFRILRSKYPDEGSNALQYKRYQWGLYKDEQILANQLNTQIKAHDALADVIVLKLLLDKLVQDHSLDSMIKLCSKPILLEKIPFGKYKGKRFLDIALTDRQNLLFMQQKQLDEDLKYTIEHVLEQTIQHSSLKIGFGKYKEKTIEEIHEIDKNYLEWLYKQDISSDLKIRILKVL